MTAPEPITVTVEMECPLTLGFMSQPPPSSHLLRIGWIPEKCLADESLVTMRENFKAGRWRKILDGSSFQHPVGRYVVPET